MSKYKISVGEPWDFEGPDGKNQIFGEVIKALSVTVIIFRSDHLINIDGISGCLFILQARYHNDILVHGEKGEEFEGVISGGLLLIEDYEFRNIDELLQNSKFVIIGSLRLRKE